MRPHFSTIGMVLIFLFLFAVAAGMHFRLSMRDQPVAEVKEKMSVASVPTPVESVQKSLPSASVEDLPPPSGSFGQFPIAVTVELPIEVNESPSPLPPEKAEFELPQAVLLQDAPVAADATVPPPSNKSSTEKETAGQRQSVPPQVVAEREKRPPVSNTFKGKVVTGDTAEKLFTRYVSNQVFQQVLAVSSKKHSLTQLRAGQSFILTRSAQGELESFEYEINSDKRLLISRSGNKYTAVVEPIRYEYRLCQVSGVINSSLFKAIGDSGENPDLAMRLAEIFASEINFIRDLQPGDKFVMILEKRYLDGEFRNYGKVLSARFVNQGTVYEGYRFRTDMGFERYFNAKGESLHKTLLKAPLPFTMITSGYSMSRKHPIYFENRPHQGVDYGAPKGTPVNAVGDGVVSKAAWGNGFGNMIIVRHTSALESMYSHLSGFARGLKSGDKVRQGQVIGYVGSTGVATGPHLDFRLKQKGKYVNPTKVINPRSEPVSRKFMQQFKNRSVQLRAYMDAKQPLNSLRSEKSFF